MTKTQANLIGAAVSYSQCLLIPAAHLHISAYPFVRSRSICIEINLRNPYSPNLRNLSVMRSVTHAVQIPAVVAELATRWVQAEQANGFVSSVRKDEGNE